MNRVFALLLEQSMGTSHVLEERCVPGGVVRAVGTLPHLLLMYRVSVSVEIWEVVCSILAVLAVENLIMGMFHLVVLSFVLGSHKFFPTNGAFVFVILIISTFAIKVLIVAYRSERMFRMIHSILTK